MNNRKRARNWDNRKGGDKRPKGGELSLEEKVAAARQRAMERFNNGGRNDNENSDKKLPKHSSKDENIMDLNSTKIHPLLRDLDSVKQQNTTREVENPLLYKNLQSHVSREALNPYFDPTEIVVNNSKRKRKGLVFNEKGKYVALADKIREKDELARIEQEEARRITEKGLDPDETLNEIAYKKMHPPRLEWWDEALFYKGKSYDDVDVNLERIEDNKQTLVLHDIEQTPITSYIQHPVPINAPWEKYLPPPKSLYLTKKELKRIRKNRRAEAHKETQDRIKLGLDPAPPPKVKLSNLMNVLTNEAIKDPTAVEMRVRQEVEQRRLQHFEENESRKLTPEQRHEKIEKKVDKDLDQQGIFSAVFKVDKLVNNKHIFKVDINAKQYKLTGVCCLRSSDFSLIIVEGSFHAIQKYKHLLLERIDWEQNVIPKTVTEQDPIEYQLQSLQGNKCHLVWEGQILKFHFQKWTTYKIESDEDTLSFLNRYKVDNYWRQAKVLQD